MSNNARMNDARRIALTELQNILKETGLKPTTLAKRAGVMPSTLNRFIKDENSSVLGTSTLTKLRAARDAVIRERLAPFDLQKLTKNEKKRALIALLLATPDDQILAIEEAVNRIPKASASKRKGDDVA